MNPKTDPEYDGLAENAEMIRDEMAELIFALWLASLATGPFTVPGFGWAK